MSCCWNGFPWSLSPPVYIVHRSRQVFQVISCVGADLLYMGSSWSSNLCSSMWGGPKGYIAYEFNPNSLVVSRMSSSSDIVMGGRLPYNCSFVECCLQDLFNTARSILVWFLSRFFSIRLVNVHMVHPCSSIDTTTAWKKTAFYFIRQAWLSYDQ